jgi:predicted nucleic acid-binding protein
MNAMPADRAYVDTSVLGAYYCPEPLSAAAENALRRIQSPVISSLTEVEFASSISRKRRLKEISERQAQEILDLFTTHVADGSYHRIAVTTEHFHKARQLICAPKIALHTLDALHLSVALTENLTLMSADRDLIKAAKRHKSLVMLIK